MYRFLCNRASFDPGLPEAFHAITESAILVALATRLAIEKQD
jgi:hypothetical protein